MSAVAIRPPRMRMVIAVAAAVYLLGYTIAQCGMFLGHGHTGDDIHVASSSALPAQEATPGHAHIDDGSTHLAHEAHAVLAMPRSDYPLRPLTVAAVVAIALAMVLVLISAPLTPRAPPDRVIPSRRGRTILNTLCINRC